ncbi:hypothetical protein [Actinoplanes regularis]|uniref:hypothetical protein n=1 Tax=Actinoplanes regularis TaxID=52697 RepID=UPI00255761B1|nr:hypothetical protein [Actinoplanes regularis]
MSRMRYTWIGLGAAVLCAAATWTVVEQRMPEPRLLSTPAAAQASLGPTGTSRADQAADRSVKDRAATPEKTTAAAAKPPKVHGTPAPFVQPFAGQPGRARIRPGKSPKAPVRVTPNVDGCDRNYGTKAQCVPVTFPKGVTDRCAWLKAHGFTGVPVAAKDRQNLDPDKNKIACG